MASQDNTLKVDLKQFDYAKDLKIGIVKAEWALDITSELEKGCIDTLVEAGVIEANISTINVPGSFELVSGAMHLSRVKRLDAIICLGCIIQGETRHFEFISNAVANGIMNLNINLNYPVIFGVLTPDNMEQAIDRIGGKQGNKGVEAAISALKMAKYKQQ